MNQLDRIVIRAVMTGRVKYSDTLPSRFADIGKAHFCRNVVDNRWALLFGHCATDYNLPLGFTANLALTLGARIAAIRTQKETP